ncbi:MAG: 2-C-methyl-D-erythritol 4-phosphate cytidylyltransferase [Thermoanaerobaculaceae bacterium]|jgi:2-C-methyl-D-erythritol 4-phosphate cytidylyltransferase/2-C-methyl-D-erythritol 2,4-cyclodiphosphate synthase|nr:2-C-methyl-D-erythritol 4-phosphate cytidylyltransferase [Thermoanaerobaculaceae bacterium]
MATDTGTAPDLALVIVAAGSARRFGADKLLQPLAGATVLEWAVRAVQAAFLSAPTILVAHPDRVGEMRTRFGPRGVAVVPGGARRQDSVRNGVEATGLSDGGVVLIHDGARPLVPGGDVRAVAAAARRSGAALLVAPIPDTVKRVGADGLVEETVPRRGLARALTPQGFRLEILRRAWAVARDAEWTDEAALVESVGGRVEAVTGDARNVKVTRREDLDAVAAAFPRRVRVGQGVDVHPFAAGRALWLCGVELTGETGLAGHSDADVALHAVTDAILGACAAGDIGVHFPPSDPRWKGAASAVFVAYAVRLAAERGMRVVHCDLTLLAEQPRIGPHREAMRARLAELLDLGPDDVGLKATTCEGLGFVGRREGVVAMAMVTLEQA